jgi:outer membrane protein TolC
MGGIVYCIGMRLRMPRGVAAVVAAGVLGAVAAGPVWAQPQPLTLREALHRAETSAYGNRIAAAEVEARAGEGLRALGGILPSVRVEAGYARTTDPIGAFGTTLRQRTLTAADFDPARLNYPAASPNYSAGLIVEQPLLNLDAHAGRRVAQEAVRAGAAAAEWSRLSTRVEVVRAWFGAVLSAEQVLTLESAHAAALAHVRQAESMERAGVVTRSDALQARVHAGEIAVQLAEARGGAGLVKRRLALLLGAPADTLFSLPVQLPTVSAIESLEALDWAGSAEVRADVRAAAAAAAAARLDVVRARATWLPRINGMARYDWNSPAAPFGGDENWSIGVVASWTLSVGSEVAETRSSAGRHAAARAQAEAALAGAELALAEDANAWEVALERMRIAEEAVAQSVEAHRIVARRYDGGLAPVVELLGVSAMETGARLRLTHARYEALSAAAARLLGMGRDPAELAGRLEAWMVTERTGTE